MAKGFFFSSFRSSSSKQRVRVSLPIVKFNGISNYLQIVTAQFYSHGKSKEARLFERLYHWYNSDIVDKRKNDFVFESWMLTSDFIPNNNNSSSPFFSRFLQLPAFSFLSSLVFCLGLFFVAGFASEVYGQFNISGTLKSIPNNDSLFGKIVFEEIPSGTKYAKAINNDGDFQLLLPEGAYKRQIEIVNHYLFIDIVAIYSDSILDKEVIKSLPINSPTYQNLNFSFLKLFYVITGTLPGAGNTIIRRWVPTDGDLTVIPTFLRVYDPNDPISMPQGWALQYDTLINYLTINNPINDVLQLNISSFNDSLHNIQHLYVINNEMPIPGTLGYTIRGPPFSNYTGYAVIWMNRQALNTNHIVQTGLREFVRSFGLESNSIDPLFVMYMSGNTTKTLHPDEINILRTLYSLTPGTDMFPYKDSVIVGVNMPPIVTAPLPNLNILEGADETFLAKLSQHFKDPENTPLNYVINGDNIVANLRNDSLFVKPLEGFFGITNLVVEAYDADGNGQFVSDISEINVSHVNHPPTPSSLLSPVNNAILNNKDQLFAGTPSTDPDGDAVTYNLHIFNATKDTSIIGLNESSFNFTDVQKLGFGEFYKWYISSTDGQLTTNSDTLSFMIKNYTQQKPELLTPVNNDTLKTKDQNFDWTETLGPNGEKGTYILRIFNSEKDTSIYADTSVHKLFTDIRSTLGSEKDYFWYVISNDGLTNVSSDTSSFNTGLLTSIKNDWKNDKGFSISNNYPNPFNGTTVISYTIAKAGNVRLSIYNSLGEEIANLVNGYQSENYYEVSFNAVNIPSGIYYYRIDATASDGSESFSSVKKLVLLK
ncbi:MAG: T9SS type A sorting domain-containing protein [Ignavibacteria bacterium]|nr:T9SS type A sorting domain-containing protein [Ignavibacteria bacterium]